MPTIPDARALGPVRVNGRATPEQINPSVAYDIGRAGDAYARAMHQIAAAFSGIGEKQAAMEDAAWLSQAKLDTLTADDGIRRETELNAGPDGTGYEQAPMRLNEAIGDVEKRPGGSSEARFKYKLWAAEQAFGTGRWAASTAQGRLKESTGTGLDKRLDEMQTLSGSNPDRALEYFKTYEEEVRSKVGYAITSQEAEGRILDGKTRIIKESVVARAIKSPADFGKAVRALEDAGAAPQLFSDANPETRARGMIRPGTHPASVSFQLETGQNDPLRGIKNISHDAGGTKSYGNFGINSGGSAQQFAAQFGKQFGLTAEPGTVAFDKQWKNAAGSAPVELHAAELEWWDKTIGSKLATNLTRAGISTDMANDPRVQAYFADRAVQYGPNSLNNHAGRIKDAFAKAGGSVEKFLSGMSATDRGKLGQDFPTALGDGTYSERGHATRVSGRERRSLAVAAGGVPQQDASVDKSRVKPIVGSIQPAELLELSAKDYHSVTTELRPHLISDTENRMLKAVSSLAAKGSQDIIAPADLDNMRPLVGAGKVSEWKNSLRDAEEMHIAVGTIKQMTPAMRRAQLSALVPTGRIEDLAEDEARRFELWSKATKHIEDRIKDDALGYLGIENESGRQAMKAIAAAPVDKSGVGAREQAFDTLIALQKQEGVPASKIRILGKQQAQSLATALGEAKSGPAAMQLIDGARATYGKHFNQMWGELVDAGAPDTYLALPTANRKGQNALIDALSMRKAVTDSSKGQGYREQLLEQAGAKRVDLRKSIANEAAEFTQALAGGNGSARVTEAYRDAIELVALKYMITDHKSLDDAVRQASSDLFKENIQTHRGVAIPRTTWDASGHAIKLGLDRGFWDLIDENEPMIIARAAQNKAYDPEYNHNRYINNLKSSPQFVSDEEMRGVYMIDGVGNYVMVDSEKGKVPMFFTWQDLERSAKFKKFYR